MAAAIELAIDFAGNATWLTALRVICTYAFGLVLSLAAVKTLMRRGMTEGDFSFFPILGIAVPSGLILFTVDVFGRAFEHGPSPLVVWPVDFMLRTRVNCAYFIVLFVFQSTITWLTASARSLAIRERHLVEAQLTALRFQLNPHFLFNTLNSIATRVADAGASEAEAMILRLSEFLQSTLATEPTFLVPLMVELDTIQAYLDIEAIRFCDRLQVEYHCDPGISEARVPHFILQPLVENAVKHSVAVSTSPVTITIRTEIWDGHYLLMTVRNSGTTVLANSEAGHGLGLRNIAARLEAIYGRAGTVVAAPDASGGFAAAVRIPLTYEEGVSL